MFKHASILFILGSSMNTAYDAIPQSLNFSSYFLIFISLIIQIVL